MPKRDLGSLPSSTEPLQSFRTAAGPSPAPKLSSSHCLQHCGMKSRPRQHLLRCFHLKPFKNPRRAVTSLQHQAVEQSGPYSPRQRLETEGVH
jgi:hypothetical protein